MAIRRKVPRKPIAARRKTPREVMSEGLNEKPIPEAPADPKREAAAAARAAVPRKEPKWEWYWNGTRRFMNGVLYDPEKDPKHGLIQVNVAQYSEEALKKARKLQKYQGEEISPFSHLAMPDDHGPPPEPDGKNRPRVKLE